MTPQQQQVVLAIANAVLETVREAGPSGAPASSIYLAFQTYGLSHDAFSHLMSALVGAGRLRHSNHTYFVA